MRQLLILCAGIFWVFYAGAQVRNTVSEVRNYREADGKIILEMVVNGVTADFALDLTGEIAILPEYMEKFRVDGKPEALADRAAVFLYRQPEVSGKITLNAISFGNNAFGYGVPAYVLKEGEYLRQLGVAGVVNGSLFANVVLTLDRKHRQITTTAPYRPAYMQLINRTDFRKGKNQTAYLPLTVRGQQVEVLFDTWYDGGVVLNKKELSRFPEVEGRTGRIGREYRTTTEKDKTTLEPVQFVNRTWKAFPVVADTLLARSRIGLALLDGGLISLDYPRQKVYFQVYEETPVQEEVKAPAVELTDGLLNPITRDYFLEHIHNYKKEQEFIYRGDRPMVIDFWATWCGPCMRLLPQMEQLAREYKGKVVFCKVNADQEKELCNVFHVEALPTLFFLAPGKKPIVEVGATFEKYKQLVEEQLLKAQ